MIKIIKYPHKCDGHVIVGSRAELDKFIEQENKKYPGDPTILSVSELDEDEDKTGLDLDSSYPCEVIIKYDGYYYTPLRRDYRTPPREIR